MARSVVEPVDHSFEIKAHSALGVGVELLMDGKPLKGVKRLSLSAEAGDVIKLALEFIPGGLHVVLPQLEEGSGITFCEAKE